MDCKGKFYLAYGSNLNLEQMKRRCPTAAVVGTAELKDWWLWFRGGAHNAVATIEHKKGLKVPVLIWRLQLQDEMALDRYEGFPFLYHKETLQVTVNGNRIYAMAYIMNANCYPYGTPSVDYLNTIREGYESLGFDADILNDAVNGSKEAQGEQDS